MDNRRTQAADHHRLEAQKNAPIQQTNLKTGKRGGDD
jgi:hypothetical protein